MAEAALYRLMTWLSPAYPVGGYSYSHGLEWAVEERMVRDRKSLQGFVETALANGAGRSDGLLLAAAWRAAGNDDGAALATVAELATAYRGSAELALEGSAQGAAFLKTTLKAWPTPLLSRLAGELDAPPTLAVTVGMTAAAWRVPLAATLTAYLQAFAAALVSAGLRLVPLGQNDGQLAMAALEPAISDAVVVALLGDLDDLATAAPVIDWCSMRHETQYTRLFRS